MSFTMSTMLSYLLSTMLKLFHINQTKTIFLVRLRCSNRKLTRKLFHIRQTKLSGYSTSGRIKPSCYSSLLFRWLFHIAVNINVATQRMGNGNKVLHTTPHQPQKQVLSLVRFRCFNMKLTRESFHINQPLMLPLVTLLMPHQCHHFHLHIWLFSLLPKEVNSSVQVHWQQWWPLMLF